MEAITWLKEGDLDELDGHLSLSYFFDAFSFKIFTLEYPTYCTFDIASLIGKAKYI